MLLRGNTFQFFFCYHKQGGGSFARLLKLRMKRDLRVKREIFLDADNLKDLNLLFRCACVEPWNIGHILPRGRVSISVLPTVGHLCVCAL